MPPVTRKRAATTAFPAPPASSESDAGLLAEQLVLQQLQDIHEMSYAKFCRVLLGLTLTRGQEAIARVVYDGEAPAVDDTSAFFGGLSEAADSFSLRVAVIVAGRGSGKSAALLAARSLHLALRTKLEGLTSHSPAALVAIVAPDLRQSRQTLAFVRAFLDSRPLLKRILQAECLIDIVRIVRPDGKRVNIEARPATAGGNSVRGPVLVGVMLEESAFFEGEGYEVNDEEIFRAARPRLVPDGQIVFASTPWAQSGKLWELYRDNFGKPDTAVVAKAPTLLVRPSDDTRRAYEAELKSDPDNARREYDAEFLSADSERFFSEALLEQCIDTGLVVPSAVIGGEVVRFGADFAFASDSSALMGFADRNGKMVCIDIDELRPQPGLPLIPSHVVSRFANRLSMFGCRVLVADDHYRESIQEHLSKEGMALSGPPSHVPSENYVKVRMLMAQGRVRISAHNRLLSQLRKVRSTMAPGGRITMNLPRAKDGGHCDLVSAMVCALAGIKVEAAFGAPAPKDNYEALARKEEAAIEARLKVNEKRLEKQARGILRNARRIAGKQWQQLKNSSGLKTLRS